MASIEAITWTRDIESSLRNIAQSFSEEEMKEAINWTSNVLEGDYAKLPKDDLFQCFNLLHQHGRLSDTTGIEFYADKFCGEDNKSIISKKIESFKKTLQCDRQDESGAELFVGRDAEILQKNAGSNVSVSIMAEIAKICCNKPLLLKGFSVILKEKLAPGEKLLADIEKNILKHEAMVKKKKSLKEMFKQKTMEVVKESTAGTYLNNNDKAVLQEMFDKLSLSLRTCLIKLSLFCRDFSLPAAQQMIGRSTKESQWYVNILISKEFLETRKGDGGEKLYSLHPLAQEFLKEERLKPIYQDSYQEGKDLFCKFYMKKLKEMINEFNANFEIERPNFEQLLELTPASLADVGDLHMLPCLLEPLLTEGSTQISFHNPAEAAIKEGCDMISEPINPDLQLYKDTFCSVAELHLLRWKELGRRLGLKNSVIDNIEVENKHNRYEQCYQMLLEWVKRYGRSACLDKLLSILSTMPECSDAVEQIVNNINSEVVAKKRNSSTKN